MLKRALPRTLTRALPRTLARALPWALTLQTEPQHLEREISLKHVQRAVVQSGRPLVALEKLEALEPSSAQLSIA